MSEASLVARLATEGLTASTWANGPLERYPGHRHGYDKVLVAAHGSITFRLPELDREVTLRAGDRLDLPADTLHAAEVGPDGVTCLEAHLTRGALDGEPRHRREWGISESEGQHPG